MKRSIISVLALTAIVACNKNIDCQTPSPITFDNSFVEIKTRAAEDPSITTATIDAFDAWAYMGKNFDKILDAERVTRQGDNTWSYQNLQYWTPNHTYYFNAIAPVDDRNIVVDTSKADEYGLGTVTFTNVDGATDLLYANKVLTTGPDVLYNDPGKIHLQFAHQLAKVKFTFTNGFPNENTKVVVKDIRMTVPAKGTVKLSERAWTVESAANVELDFGDANAGAPIGFAESEECDYQRLTIPCDENRSYAITFTVELYHGTYDQPAYTKEQEVTMTGHALKIGKNYNLRATLGADNLDLLPIEFDVLEVAQWDEGATNEIM